MGRLQQTVDRFVTMSGSTKASSPSSASAQHHASLATEPVDATAAVRASANEQLAALVQRRATLLLSGTYTKDDRLIEQLEERINALVFAGVFPAE